MDGYKLQNHKMIKITFTKSVDLRQKRLTKWIESRLLSQQRTGSFLGATNMSKNSDRILMLELRL